LIVIDLGIFWQSPPAALARPRLALLALLALLLPLGAARFEPPSPRFP
jgi:hypothetical protein